MHKLVSIHKLIMLTALAGVVAAMVAAGRAGAALTLVGSTLASPQQIRGQAADPLVGTWETGLIPLGKIRATLATHGYTAKSIDNFFHKNNHFVKGIDFRISFYRQNGVPFQITYAWDPTHGSLPDGDHGPYSLLPGDRFVSRGTDPPTDTFLTTFGYTVTGTRLRLHFVSLVEPGLSAKQRLSDEKRPILMASTMFKKVK